MSSTVDAPSDVPDPEMLDDMFALMLDNIESLQSAEDIEEADLRAASADFADVLGTTPEEEELFFTLFETVLETGALPEDLLSGADVAAE